YIVEVARLAPEKARVFAALDGCPEVLRAHQTLRRNVGEATALPRHSERLGAWGAISGPSMAVGRAAISRSATALLRHSERRGAWGAISRPSMVSVALLTAWDEPVEPGGSDGQKEPGDRHPGDEAEDGQKYQGDGGEAEVAKRLHGDYSTSRIISISTGIPIGSSAMPTADRACLPMASPKTSTIRSEKPLMTLGWSPNPSAELTMPSTFTTRFTRSRLPSAARVVARRFRPTSRAT